MDNIHSSLRKITGFKQWRNATSVVAWFNAIPNKQNSTFLKFDLVDFYPRISEKFFTLALNQAREVMDNGDTTTKIIVHACKLLSFCEGTSWIKKPVVQFNLDMGLLVGAEICKLVRLFLLHQLFSILDKDDVGLYRDNGRAVLQNTVIY